MNEENQILNQENLSPTENEGLTNVPVGADERIEKLGKELQKALNDSADTKTITILGFIVIIIMVATMLLALITLFVEVLKDNKTAPVSIPQLIYETQQ